MAARRLAQRGRNWLLCAAALASTAAAAHTVAAQPPAGQPVHWAVKSREHVDLWLHGFALLSEDTSKVPLFRRGYRDSLTITRLKSNASTDLDANRETLARRLRANPALVNAQFLALSFGTWAELDAAIDAFLKADGDPRSARNREGAGEVAMIASVFATKDDREFARQFQAALRSERDRFFHAWWLTETRHRDRTLAAVDSLWQQDVRPKLQRYLDHTQQGNGEMILSPAIEGEGRTVNGGKAHGTIVVGFPESPDHAADAIYAFLHEAVGPLVDAAVADNTTPAEKRSGVAERLQSAMLVRAGALLAKRVSSSLGDGYVRFYLRVMGVAEGSDAWGALSRTLPVPQALIDSIDRQIAIAFGGI